MSTADWNDPAVVKLSIERLESAHRKLNDDPETRKTLDKYLGPGDHDIGGARMFFGRHIYKCVTAYAPQNLHLVPIEFSADSEADMLGWAVKRADGDVIVEIGQLVTESSIWQLALGWPSEEEVQDNIRRGGRAFRCKVVEVFNQ